MPLTSKDTHHESPQWWRDCEQTANEQGQLAKISCVHVITLAMGAQQR
jgi:hypothetical protein